MEKKKRLNESLRRSSRKRPSKSELVPSPKKFRPISPGVTNSGTESRNERATRREQKLSDLTMPPGVTGLGNLGNTCYMNAVLQVLSNLDEFRDHFLAYCSVKPVIEFNEKDSKIHPEYNRQTTVECNELVTNPRRRTCSENDLTQHYAKSSCLSDEVHALMRVMWSGSYPLVIPKGFLHAVWSHVPSFKGNKQQDAQEFLSEILSKLGDELNSDGSPEPEQDDEGFVRPLSPDRKSVSNFSPPSASTAVKDWIHWLFNGNLESRVTCVQCGHKSITNETFSDLSLDFPDQLPDNKNTGVCHILEMLQSFTGIESLGQVYECENCCGNDQSYSEDDICSSSKATQNSSRKVAKTEAEKNIVITKLPKIVRLHLKRFRWSSKNGHQKLSDHVKFEEILDVKPFCVENTGTNTQYRLCAVVNHHGRGFNSGHYTSYCWNSQRQFWLFCNDASLKLCSVDQVLNSQAYILFYSRIDDQGRPAFALGDDKDEQIRRSQSEETLMKLTRRRTEY